MREKLEIQKEIQNHLKSIKELTELIPLGLMLSIGWGFVIPVFSRRGPSLADEFGYKNAAIFGVILSTSIYLISYFLAIKKRKKEIEILEKELINYNRIEE